VYFGVDLFVFDGGPEIVAEVIDHNCLPRFHNQFEYHGLLKVTAADGPVQYLIDDLLIESFEFVRRYLVYLFQMQGQIGDAGIKQGIPALRSILLVS
jgi:hypothetical protein